MSTRPISVDVLTSSYRMQGQLEVTNSGALGVMSDSTCSFIELRSANMARIHMANKLPDIPQNIRVVKSQASAVCLSRREDVGPLASGRSVYGRYVKYPIRITSPVFEVEGTFEWAGRFDLAVIMEGINDFFPLYDASMGAILFPSLLIQAPVILFNRRFLSTFVVTNE